MTIARLFKSAGPLTRILPGYQFRHQQQAMAKAVEASLSNNVPLICEAGTGTGKTMAYLLPALASGQRLIISTGTRNLQEQLFYKDLPTAIAVLGQSTDSALLKGRSNYLCLHRLEQYANEGRFDDTRIPADLARIRTWATRTGSGDIAELGQIPETAIAWRYATSNRDNCLGGSCDRYDDCHLMAARQRAMDSQVVVVNHHLLLGHLALDAAGHGELLPAADVVIIDEAHQLPGIANDFFGLHLGSAQILELCRDVDVVRRTEAREFTELSEEAGATTRLVNDFRVSFGEPSARLSWSDAQRTEDCQTAASGLCAQLERLTQALAATASHSRALSACAERAREQLDKLEDLQQVDATDHLSWLDITRKGFTWHLSPLQIGEPLGGGFTTGILRQYDTDIGNTGDCRQA